MSSALRPLVAVGVSSVIVSASAVAFGADPYDRSGQVIVGIKISAGARYDTVRRCVATDAGTPGGPAADVSFFAEFGVTERSTITVDLPVMRPILFAAAFDMLQFEPEVTLATRVLTAEDVHVLVGAGLGLSLHYGPDYRSELSDEAAGPSFFALGPRSSLYVGLDFPRPGEVFNFQLGLRPYLTALASLDESEGRSGPVLGGQLEGELRFDTDPAPAE